MTEKLPVVQEQHKTEIVRASDRLFGQLTGTNTEAEKERVTALINMGFDPRFHLEIYEGRAWVNKYGAHWWASQDERYAGIVSELITDPNVKVAYGLQPDEIGVLSHLYIHGQDQRPFVTGFGKASTKAYQSVEKGHPDRRRNPLDAQYPYLMAEKRAEVQAIRKFRPPSFNWQLKEEREGHIYTDAAVIEGKAEVLSEVSEAAPTTPSSTQCPTHNIQMTRKENSKGEAWYSHQEGKKWCNWTEDKFKKFLAEQPLSSEPPVEPQEAPASPDSDPQAAWSQIYEVCSTVKGMAEKASEWVKENCDDLRCASKYFSGNPDLQAGFPAERATELLNYLQKLVIESEDRVASEAE